MRAPNFILIALAAVAGSVLPATATPFWQKHNPPPVSARPMPQASVQAPNELMAQAGPARPGAPPPASAGQQFHLYGPGPHQGDWLRKYFGLPPAQWEQTLQKDPSFQALPPDAQKHLLDRLRTFNSLDPEKQQKILNRMEF